jgi:endoglucanase
VDPLYRLFGIALMILLLEGCGREPLPCQAEWSDYDRFISGFVNDQGQVLDPATSHTTSEGQSYALFFSVLANDRDRFNRILNWTESHLAAGSLANHLPAWAWGGGPDGHETILDPNSAADADLWLSYTLIEAGRLWNDAALTARGQALAVRILETETASLPALGTALLPGQSGFVNSAGNWRLNPSYLPPFILTRLASETGADNPWKEVRESSREVIGATLNGYAGDWMVYSKTGFTPDTETRSIGSYDAIRVYLWTGLTSPDDLFWKKIPPQLHGMTDWLKDHPAPPEKVDIRTGEGSGEGPFGFSAALLPYVQRLGISVKDPIFQRLKEKANDLGGDPGYYSQSLRLFGIGFTEQRFRFDLNGKLETSWGSACKP